MLFIIPFLGILVGCISGFFGIGGGTIVVPIMMALGYDIKEAVGISILQMLFSAIFGSYLNYKAGKLRLDSGVIVGLGGFCGASLSGFIVANVASIVLEIGLLLTLTIAFCRVLMTNVENTTPKEPAKILLFAVGFAIGAIAISMGVGGAIFLTPILVGFLGVDIKKAVSMGLFFVIFSSFSGFLSMAYNGNVQYLEGVLMGLGGLVGVYFGTKISHKVAKSTQKKCLLVMYVVMFLLALKKTLGIDFGIL
ncbi:sulfite exporter TauE/SafE family protein [Campylobacter sp. JMF_06 NA1]|uniref:sulfite exporter TauE/SafE family protein n=1 Tax=Campylobacter sp. JMF_06 NA1 TaxID=2983823 RepID=UPI0022E9A0EE|nr:sulfite exporter TauE/SafE family protein [Campylobacter sp. JMF_06 NA1]MDA3078136.1 sulfite exporter TauE/SafE family protein [Campylobacter sp. JMF_06 NA1]